MKNIFFAGMILGLLLISMSSYRNVLNHVGLYNKGIEEFYWHEDFNKPG